MQAGHAPCPCLGGAPDGRRALPHHPGQNVTAATHQGTQAPGLSPRGTTLLAATAAQAQAQKARCQNFNLRRRPRAH